MTLPTTGDRSWLAHALMLATTARGRTAPNPHVGCVLVRDGAVVAEGATAPVGGPHAEASALAAAGEAARGATAYVTLEPCAHHGRTPPCADALIAAGVARVVVALPDPHDVAAGGAARLRDAGIEVAVLPPASPLRRAVAAELGGFLSLVARGRPQVTLKLAQTTTGALHVPGRWVTGPAARRAVHRWRAAADAVLVGSGTVLADDPGLDVRHVSLHDRPQPRPIVLDGRLRTPPAATVVRRGALVVTVASTLRDPEGARRAEALTAAGAEVVAVAADPSGTRPAPTAALRAVAAAGVGHVFAEPGGTLASAMLAADVVDRLVLHVAAATSPADVPDASDPDGFVAACEVPVGAFVTARLGGAGPDVVWERIRTDAGPDAGPRRARHAEPPTHPDTEVA